MHTKNVMNIINFLCWIIKVLDNRGSTLYYFSMYMCMLAYIHMWATEISISHNTCNYTNSEPFMEIGWVREMVQYGTSSS